MFPPSSVAPATSLRCTRLLRASSSAVRNKGDELVGRREALTADIAARENEALERLAAATGGQSLCSLSRGPGPVPAVKYYEGEAAALAQARRALRRLPPVPDAVKPEGDTPPDDAAAREVLRDLRDRWTAQADGPGRSGVGWAGYLAGGVDAVERLIAGYP